GRSARLTPHTRLAWTHNRRMRRLAMLGAAIALHGGVRSPAQPSRARHQMYSLVRTYPHDPSAFTQGLEYHDGFLYEGTGLNGRSSIRKVRLETGEVVQKRALPSQYFGEGITIWKAEIVELTWRSQIGFTYDLSTVAPKRTFSYSGEGWGLTHDDRSLIMSDGSAAIRFFDPDTFAERRRIVVADAGVPITRLNELEYVRGEI